MRCLALLALAAATLSAASAADTSPQALGKGFIPAAPGQTCADACSAAGKRAAVFRHLDTETALCAVAGDGWTPGWQITGSGNASCAASLSGARRDEGAFACLCLEAGEVQGIDLPKPGKPCAAACGKSITGLPGRPITASADAAGGFACLSLPSELGDLNRFGHTHGNEGDLCRTAIGAAATETDSYTCFCVFDKVSAGPAPSA